MMDNKNKGAAKAAPFQEEYMDVIEGIIEKVFVLSLIVSAPFS